MMLTAKWQTVSRLLLKCISEDVPIMCKKNLKLVSPCIII